MAALAMAALVVTVGGAVPVDDGPDGLVTVGVTTEVAMVLLLPPLAGGV